MYNDTIKVANKIITDKDLEEIFQKMYEDSEKYKKISKQEEIQNQVLQSEYQNWSLKYLSDTLSFRVNFYDDTEIKFDNYNNFIGIFNNRLHEIKNITVRYSLNYNTKHPNTPMESYSQSIYMDIYESKADINVSLSSQDRKMDEVYNLIKEKVLNAPPKYDRIIKKKSSIINKVGFAKGLIPSIIISTLLLFIPTVREIFSASYVLYPICTILLGSILGSMLNAKVESLYESIIKDKKYAGYDHDKGKSIYKDDLDKYMTTGEILIGKNVDNLKKRNEIAEIEAKNSKKIPYELGIILIISVIVIFL